jgi:hypothetical protein
MIRDMKMMISIGIFAGGLLGGWLGSLLDGGFGGWSILIGGLIGPMIGLWAGYKVGKNLSE